jgi:hypothetical protein
MHRNADIFKSSRMPRNLLRQLRAGGYHGVDRIDEEDSIPSLNDWSRSRQYEDVLLKCVQDRELLGAKENRRGATNVTRRARKANSGSVRPLDGE